MSLPEMIVLSVALSMDMFSVAVPLGMNRLRLRRIILAAFVFAGTHVGMLLGGYHVGHWLGGMVEHEVSDHINWPAAAVQDWAGAVGSAAMAMLGVRMIRAARSGGGEGAVGRLRGATLVAIALSVSLDALTAGFCLGMMDVDLWLISAVLGAVIFVVASAGLSLGRRLGRIIGERAEEAGGLALLALAVHVFWTAVS